jgi:hypothetical protein
MGARILQALDGRTLKWLSLRSGVAEQTLSNATRHGSMLGADKALRVARSLRVSLEWLIDGEAAAGMPEAPSALVAGPTGDESATAKVLARMMPPAGPGRRMRWPSWYQDKPVLEAVVASHRQAEIDRVLADLQERFGARAPSRSSLGRFWLRLDSMFQANGGRR